MKRRLRTQRAVQAARRLVQAGSMALVLLLVWLSLYGHYRAARVIDDDSFMKGWRGALLRSIDAHVSRLEDPQRFLDTNKGSYWSARIGGFDVTDPLAAAETAAASRRLHGPLLASIVLPVLASILLGKVFCAWICPAGLLFELTGKLRSLLRFAELPPAEVRFSRGNKYLLLAAGLAIVAAGSLPIFALVYPPAVVGRIFHGWVYGTAVTGMILMLGAVILIELLVSPRWWCRTMCPGGALYGILGARRSVRVELDAASCTGCGICRDVCEAGINPVLESSRMECDNCGVCVRDCPDDALLWAVRMPGRSPGTALPRSAAPGPSSGTTAGLVAAVLWLSGAAAAPAHHILGLPHYEYKENYPQRPTLEYPAASGPYDIVLTSYPGQPVPRETVNLAMYVKDRDTGRPYERELRLTIRRQLPFGELDEVLPETVVPPYEVPHKASVTFPVDGCYVVELALEVEGQTERIPFPMTIGDPPSPAAILGGSGGAFLLLVIVVRAVKIKRRRRQTMRSMHSAERR